VNGDIHTADDALEAIRQSGADGVMIGRSLIGAPWNLRDIIAGVDGLPKPAPLSNAVKGEIAIRHYRDLINFYPEGKGIRVARKHLSGYVEHLGLTNEAEIRSKICRSEDPEEVVAILANIYDVSLSELAA